MTIKAKILATVGAFEVVRITGIKKPVFSLSFGVEWRERGDQVGYWPAGSTVDDLYPTTVLREYETVDQAIDAALEEDKWVEWLAMNPEAD